MTPLAEPSRAASPTDLASRLASAETALAYKSGLLDAILEQMVQGLMLVNAGQIVEVCNRRAIELLGLPPALMARRPRFIEVLEYQWSTDEFSKTPPALKQFVRDGGILDQSQCYERMRPDGRVIEVQSVPLDGGGVLRTYTDVTVRHHDEAKLQHRARHDGLTSLLNREAFIEQLAAKIACPGGASGFAVHYVDLDKFKPINDRLGHRAGDRVLAIVADRLRAVAREGDAVARLGGDEFAIPAGRRDRRRRGDPARGAPGRFAGRPDRPRRTTHRDRLLHRHRLPSARRHDGRGADGARRCRALSREVPRQQSDRGVRGVQGRRVRRRARAGWDCCRRRSERRRARSRPIDQGRPAPPDAP